MPTRSERAKERKFVRVPSGKVRTRYFKGKPSKHKCAICGSVLHGVPPGRRAAAGKLAKSEKRPSVAFGGVLCGKCRNMAVEEAAKVKTGAKEMKQVVLGIRKYVEAFCKRIG